MKDKHSLAVDIGGTKMAICALDKNGIVAGDIESIPIPFNDKHVADLEIILEIIHKKYHELKKKAIKIPGIGISICGSVDPMGENVIYVPNLYWRNIPLRKLVSEKIGIPVFVDQDTRAAALGEAVWGIAKGIDSFYWVTVGTGVGSAMFLNGSLFTGVHGYSGWLGHSTVDEINGPVCSCGRRGCLETYVSGPWITKKAEEIIRQGRGQGILENTSGNPVMAADVFEAAREGDSAAVEIAESVVHLLAKSIGTVVNILDIQLVILGGGVIKHSPVIADLVLESIPPFIAGKEILEDLQIKPESLPNSALFGAGAMVFRCLNENGIKGT